MKFYQEVILVWIKDPKVLLTLFTMLSSLVGFSGWNWAEASKEAEASQQQVTAIAEAYYPAVKETLTIKERTIIQSDCKECKAVRKDFDTHMRRLH